MSTQEIKDALFDEENLVDFVDGEDLEELGKKVVSDYEIDLGTRTDWEKKRAQWLELFMGHVKEKTFPWPKAANIPVPILTTAVIQFQARAYEALMPAKNKIKIDTTGTEDDLRSDRVSRHMNYQLNYGMEDFEEGWDVSLFQLPINGSIFRKTYYDPVLEQNVSKYCPVTDIVVDYNTNPMDVPKRLTHVLYFDKDDMKVREELGVFDGIDEQALEGGGDQASLHMAQTEIRPIIDGLESQQQPPASEDTPRTVLEQHRWWDLDGDGVEEPYVVTVDKETQQVIRITKRKRQDGKVVNYFTHYYFFPNPEGYYGLGFGHILAGLNEAAKSILNQIIDAGTLANLSGKTGFVNKRAGLRKGDVQLKLGDYTGVDVNSDDIRKSIYSFDFPGPSQVLFAVLGLLQDMSDRVTTVSETMHGELPSSDTPATAIVSAVEQGMKVFSTIHKRIHRTFKKELKKIYLLNELYTEQEDYLAILGDFYVQKAQENQVEIDVKADYAQGFDVMPVSDPNITSRAEKVAIAEQVLQHTLQNPFTGNNPNAVFAAYGNFYESLGIDDWQKFYPPPPPPPDLPQEQENGMFLREQDVDALPQQLHTEHLRIMADFEISTYFDELSARGKNLFDQHRQQHLGFQYEQDVAQGNLVPNTQRMGNA